MEKLSWGDDLTGLYNRRGFKILANQTINMAHRMKLNATLIFIDLDELKWINDFRGHAAGDQALIDTAQILKEVFRSSDIIARVGGDEFVALAINSAENPSGKLLERLQEQLDIHNTWFGKDYVLSFSCGSAHYEWENPNSLEMLLEEADQAMYANKRQKNHMRSSIANSTPALAALNSRLKLPLKREQLIPIQISRQNLGDNFKRLPPPKKYPNREAKHKKEKDHHQIRNIKFQLEVPGLILIR